MSMDIELKKEVLGRLKSFRNDGGVYNYVAEQAKLRYNQKVEQVINLTESPQPEDGLIRFRGGDARGFKEGCGLIDTLISNLEKEVGEKESTGPIY